ncbi:hypothetical protein Tco_1145231 [Tanacetum coccineum]
MQRLTNLEQQNRADAIEESVHANVLNEVKNQLPKLLPKAVSNALKKTPVNLSQPTPTPSVDPSEYELKHLLSTKPSHNKRTHDDQDPEDGEGEKSKNRRRKCDGESSSMKNKDQKEPTHFERGNDVDEPRQDDEQEHKGHKLLAKQIPGKHNPVWFQKIVEERPVQSWINELVDAEEEPEDHEYKYGSVTLFGKLVKKIFKKDKITKEDVDGPSFELLKGTCKNSIELEYNIYQSSLALTDRIDWINPEGDRFHQDLSKPLPLTPLGKKRSPVNYFFNHDLEYLVKGSKNITEIFVTGKLFYKGNVGFPSRHEVYSKTDEKEYKFCEADFPYLNQNDIEDLYILKIQNKIHNKGTKEYDLINALKMYISRIVIKKRVEDVQMGVESYQTKLNLTKPQLMGGCLHQFTPYTIINHPLGVVYEGVNDRKRLIRDNELHKFCDGTLNKVLNKLQIILRNNRLGYDNEGMEKYKWTKEDEKKTKKFVDKIEKTLKERKRFRRLKLFVGGRRDKTDYRLLVKHE